MCLLEIFNLLVSLADILFNVNFRDLGVNFSMTEKDNTA